MTEGLPLPLRAVTDADADALIALIGAAYAEHPGCVLDLPGVDDDLPAPGTTAARRGGRWWVVTDGEEVVASVGAGGVGTSGSVELKRLYVRASHRRRGLAAALVRRVEEQAAGLGASRVELWSDTRFTDAHRLYARQGYLDTGERRLLHDPSDTTEIRFERPIDPRPPRRSVRLPDTSGVERCELVTLPDGTLLRGRTDDPAVTYEVEVDDGWWPLVATVADATGSRRLTSDGRGRWWLASEELSGLAGCTDVEVHGFRSTDTVPIRRALAAGIGHLTVRTARIGVPGTDVTVGRRRYERLDEDRWRRSSDDASVELRVDDEGLIVG